jgi:hypothetical protein
MFRVRRTVTIVALVALLAGVGTADAPAAAPRLQRQILTVSPLANQTVTVPLLALPLPNAADRIGPGSHLLITMDGDPNLYACTGNFVWASGGQTYLGAAGHCFLPPNKTATAGPGADWNPNGTHVKVCISNCLFGGQLGFIVTGTLVDLGPVAYARQSANGEDVGNDFGVVAIPSGLAAYVNPSMPVWGGPAGLAVIGAGSPLCFYGNAAGLGEIFLTKARLGIGVSSDGSSWQGVAPSLPGDSGAAVEICGLGTPAAAGILTHGITGTPVVFGTTIARAIAMATEAGLSLSVVNG